MKAPAPITCTLLIIGILIELYKKYKALKVAKKMGEMQRS